VLDLSEQQVQADVQRLVQIEIVEPAFAGVRKGLQVGNNPCRARGPVFDDAGQRKQPPEQGVELVARGRLALQTLTGQKRRQHSLQTMRVQRQRLDAVVDRVDRVVDLVGQAGHELAQG